MSVFMAGGALRTGQAVGATNSRGDEPVTRAVAPNDLLATWYRHLGVPRELLLRDFSGRPTPIVPEGRPIEELF
jgi:hypothetical protein